MEPDSNLRKKVKWFTSQLKSASDLWKHYQSTTPDHGVAENFAVQKSLSFGLHDTTTKEMFPYFIYLLAVVVCPVSSYDQNEERKSNIMFEKRASKNWSFRFFLNEFVRRK